MRKLHPPSPERNSVNTYQQPQFSFRSRLFLLSLLFASVPLLLKPLKYFGFWQTDRYLLCSPSGSEAVYTVDSKKPMAQCLSIESDLIQGVGSLDELQPTPLFALPAVLDTFTSVVLGSLWKTPVQYIDAGHIVVPGLADAHAHILEWGYKMNLRLDGLTSVDDAVSRVAEYAKSHPNSSEWIEGMGWDQTRWDGKAFPTKEDFDRVPELKNRLISLSRVDGHAKWVSSAVLRLMGDIPTEVEGGKVVRNANGEPTGIFIDNAMDLIPTPPWSHEKMREYFDLAMHDALAHGLTSIHDAGSTADSIEFFKKLAEDGDIPIRLYLMALIDPLSVPLEEQFERLPRLENYGKDSRLTTRSVKMVADGALGSWGAALLSPYSDDPSTTGIMRTTEEALEAAVRYSWGHEWQTNIHCIGDRANHVVLNVFERVLTEYDQRQEGQELDTATKRRPRIEHAQILTQEDLKRIGKLGVIPSVQPTHATSDMGYAETRLGSDRIEGAYAYQTLLQAHPQHILPTGSDFPIEDINPLLGFHAAVSRTNLNGGSPHGPGGWYPSEALTRVQALKGMTLDAAHASFAEATIGSLEKGKKADFVVLDRDIMRPDMVLANETWKAQVVATVVDGKVVYGRI